MVQVVNLYIISNSGGKVVVAEKPNDPVIRFPLPEGATNLQFQEGELGDRYVETKNGFGDRMGIAPGEGQHQVLYAYTLPYDRKLDLEIPVPLPVDAAIVMVPPGGVRLKSDQLQDAGQRDVQGMAYQMYQADSSLAAGEPLKFTLSGKVGVDGAAAEDNSLNFLLIGLGIFGAALIGAGYWLYRQRAGQLSPVYESGGESPVDEEETSESLLDAIVALDDLHATGGLPEAAYQERRAELKARLAVIMDQEKKP